MGKQFTKIYALSSNEVSLCTKYNAGANKQTQFEIVKYKENEENLDLKPVLKELVNLAEAYDEELADKREDKVEEMEEPSILQQFKDFLNYWLEYDLNDCMYNLLSESLQNAIYDIAKDHDYTKEEKIGLYQQLFNTFVEEYKRLPITKTKEGKYEVSLVSKSHIQDSDTNPQNETDVITKENTSEMEKQEQLNVIQKAFDTLVTALGLKKTETPADEQPTTEEATEEVKENVEETVENKPEVPAETEEQPAEEETPVVEQKAEEPVEKTETNEEVATEEVTEEVVETEIVKEPAKETVAEEPVEEPIEKTADIANEIEQLKKAKETVENELAELKKTNEKMTFVQKAKDEYSMLSGTPEEIGETLYAISKSNLDDNSKEFVLEQLKKVSKENAEMVQEVGSITKNAGDMTDEEVVYAKAQEIAKAKGISVNKALREIK